MIFLCFHLNPVTENLLLDGACLTKATSSDAGWFRTASDMELELRMDVRTSTERMTDTEIAQG